MSAVNSKQLGLGLSELTGHFSQALCWHFIVTAKMTPLQAIYWILKHNGMDPGESKGAPASLVEIKLGKNIEPLILSSCSLDSIFTSMEITGCGLMISLLRILLCHSSCLGLQVSIPCQKLFWWPCPLHCKVLTMMQKVTTSHSGLATFSNISHYFVYNAQHQRVRLSMFVNSESTSEQQLSCLSRSRPHLGVVSTTDLLPISSYQPITHSPNKFFHQRACTVHWSMWQLGARRSSMTHGSGTELLVLQGYKWYHYDI